MNVAEMNMKRISNAQIVAVAIVIVILLGINSLRVDPSFATQARVKFYYVGKHIDTTITDPDDIKALKEILRGWKYPETGIPCCGYVDTTSITLTDGRRSITFCPACDTCACFRIGNSNWYIDVSEKQRKRFEAIVRKYGMTFPCV